MPARHTHTFTCTHRLIYCKCVLAPTWHIYVQTHIKILCIQSWNMKASSCMFNLGDCNPGEIKNARAVFCVRGNHHHSAARQYNARCKSHKFPQTNYTREIKSQHCHEPELLLHLYLMNSLQSLSQMCSMNYLAHAVHNLQGSDELPRNHLDFRYHCPPFGAGASKCSERCRGHHWAGPGKAAEVTARYVILLVPHDDGIHDKEASPWQPQSVLLGDEWSALKVQGYGYAPVGHQVKTGTQTCTMSARMNVDTHTVKTKMTHFK